MEARNESSQETDNLADQVMENVTGDGAAEEQVQEQPAEATDDAQEELPLYAKEKIGKLQKRHQRDMRRLQERIEMLESRSQPESDNQITDSAMNPYAGNPSQGGSGVDEQIQRAVSLALQAKEDQERKAKSQQEQAHIAKQYQNLQHQLDKAADKYDDFHEVVMANDVPYTPHMRDAMLMVENPGDVLYKLGKNRPELERIAKLHPLDQAKEMLKLSAALMSGEKSNPAVPKTLGQVKNSPVNSSRDVTEKTSIGELRRRLRAGWK